MGNHPRVLLACLLAFGFAGCRSVHTEPAIAVADDAIPSLLGEWRGVHEIPGSGYTRSWTVSYRRDGTYTAIHRVYLSANAPRESASSGVWRLEGDTYLERVDGSSAGESRFKLREVGEGRVEFIRADGYSFILEQRR